MNNFKEIAEKCLAGELNGTFVLRNGKEIDSKCLVRYHSIYYPYTFFNKPFTYTNSGDVHNGITSSHECDIVNFIPNNMKEQIKIDIPEGMEVIREENPGEIKIKFIKKPLSYKDIENKLPLHTKIQTQYFWDINVNECYFSKKVEVLRKLINIRNYFGKPDSYDRGYCIDYNSSTNKFYVGNVNTIGIWTKDIVFAKKEHVEQAIKMLGDELKYLFKPW